jgi:hypothetical protein
MGMMWLSPGRRVTPLKSQLDIRETSELSRITCDWYRVRAFHDGHVAPEMNQFCAISPAFFRLGRSPMSRPTSIELDPSGLNDIELASEFLEAARRIDLTRPSPRKSN